MIGKTLLGLGIGFSSIFGYCVTNEERNIDSVTSITCTLDNLEDHGFIEHQNEFKEYVCVNDIDSSDNIIVYDMHNEYVSGDNLTVVFFHDDIVFEERND